MDLYASMASQSSGAVLSRSEHITSKGAVLAVDVGAAPVTGADVDSSVVDTARGASVVMVAYLVAKTTGIWDLIFLIG